MGLDGHFSLKVAWENWGYFTQNGVADGEKLKELQSFVNELPAI